MAGRDGTGRDGIFLGKILGGTGRVFFFFEAGRGGCCFFPRRDGAVVFFSRSGTGRLYFFSEAGRGGCIFFPRRDGAVEFIFEAGRDGVIVFFQRRDRAVVFFVRAGTGIFFFSAGTGRLTVVVFSAGTVLFIRVPSGGGYHFMKSVMVVAPTVLPTGNDEDGTRKLQILAPCL